jgi:Raf kinase inhibitor-like YbhB/YbcL family protein
MIVPLVLALTLTSPDLRTGATVPKPLVWNHDGCNGANRRPRLAWDAPPPATHDVLLTVIDPDAPKPGGWVHWRIVVPAATRSIGATIPPGAIEGKNDYGTVGWGGPCPPPGKLHHYVFTLSARDLNGRVIASSRLTPVYKR